MSKILIALIALIVFVVILILYKSYIASFIPGFWEYAQLNNATNIYIAPDFKEGYIAEMSGTTVTINQPFKIKSYSIGIGSITIEFEEEIKGYGNKISGPVILSRGEWKTEKLTLTKNNSASNVANDKWINTEKTE